MTDTKATRLHEVPGFTGTAYLYRMEKPVRYFIVSGTHVMFSGWEVLVFPADKNGEVLHWGEVAGGRGISFDEAVADLEASNPKKCPTHRAWDHCWEDR